MERAGRAVGETWAYREPGKGAASLIPAEVLQIGPAKSKKVRIRFLGGEYPGLDAWVPYQRLVALWEDAEAFLADERRYAAVREASMSGWGTVEHRAAYRAIHAYPRPDGLMIGYPHPEYGEPPMVTAPNLAEVAEDLGIGEADLCSEPLAYLDRFGTYTAPWGVAERLAKRIAEVYPEHVLAHVEQEERELREGALYGEHREDGRGERRRCWYVAPERFVERLREEQPAFNLVRAWCGQAAERYDEVAALRAEVERLRGLVHEAANWLQNSRHPRVARRLRDAAVDPGVGVDHPVGER